MSDYIKDITEDQKWSQSMGQAQILEAGEEDKEEKKLPDEKKVGNQPKEYYEQ